MKRQTGLKVYDFNLNYYFVDGDEVLVLSKEVSDRDFKKASASHLQIYQTPLSQALFHGEDKYKQHSSYRFLAIDFANVDEDTKSKIIDLMRELLSDLEIMEQRGFTILIYFNDLDVSIQMLLETLNYDFDTNVKLFSTGKVLIRNRHAFSRLLNAYIDYSHKRPQHYTDVQKLIMDVNKENHQALKQLRSPILGSLYEDDQIKKMMFTLFSNNLNVTKTAEQVYMHRNTINNKLNYIYGETSLNIQVFHDALAMYLLLFA